jgi:hypothetical protein
MLVNSSTNYRLSRLCSILESSDLVYEFAWDGRSDNDYYIDYYIWYNDIDDWFSHFKKFYITDNLQVYVDIEVLDGHDCIMSLTFKDFFKNERG